ncbi:MAG: hypothetical protein EA369_04190 [Bradymonadales bacterium]|nr:MAG: hypothetical protein EA369_04190 [Bradymonadales bacterium]
MNGCSSLGFRPDLGTSNYKQSTDIRSYIQNHRPQLIERVDRSMKAGNYERIFIIEFMPNDFNQLRVSNTLHLGDIPIGDKRAALSQWKLEDGSAFSFTRHSSTSTTAPTLTTGRRNFEIYENDPLLGKLSFRHSVSPQAALDDISSLFGGFEGANFHRTMLVGMGGSHGAHQLRNFRRRLIEETGRDLDWIILGDAIQQPFVIPMTQFFDVNETPRVTYHFYQRRDFLSGRPINGFYNIRLTNSNHHQAAVLYSWYEFFSDLTERSGKLSSRADAIQRLIKHSQARRNQNAAPSP